MQTEVTPLDGSKAIGITFTDKPVTAFGGLTLFVAFAERIGLGPKLAEVLPFVLTSPNATPPHHNVLAFLAGVLAGARRFAQLAVLQADVPIRQLFGLRRFSSTATVTRFFRRFTPKAIIATFEPLWTWRLDRLPAQLAGYTLDLDSSVFERYGSQEGALKGYNPKKRGRPSHHPLFAMLAEARCIAHVWLRSGNTASARGATAFLAETLALLAGRVRVTLVRADSGFFEEAILTALGAAALPYAIAARFTSLLQAGVCGLAFRPFAPGLAVAEQRFQARRWSRARRIVVVRDELAIRPAARGRALLQVPGYWFHAVVTTLTTPPEDVWRTAHGRADSENRIKELKHAFGADGFCSRRFAGTEAALRFICLLYNLVGEFQRSLGQRTLRTARDPADHALRVWGHPGRQRAITDAPAVPRETLAGHVPRVPPTPAPVSR